MHAVQATSMPAPCTRPAGKLGCSPRLAATGHPSLLTRQQVRQGSHPRSRRALAAQAQSPHPAQTVGRRVQAAMVLQAAHHPLQREPWHQSKPAAKPVPAGPCPGRLTSCWASRSSSTRRSARARCSRPTLTTGLTGATTSCSTTAASRTSISRVATMRLAVRARACVTASLHCMQRAQRC